MVVDCNYADYCGLQRVLVEPFHTLERELCDYDEDLWVLAVHDPDFTEFGAGDGFGVLGVECEVDE